jgi:hypothetical protein
MTNAEVAERKALVDVFPQGQPLMCYFHIKKACEEKLQKKMSSPLTKAEFDTKFSNKV